MNWEQLKEINWKQLSSFISGATGVVNLATKVFTRSHEKKKVEDFEVYNIKNQENFYEGVGLLSCVFIMTFAIVSAYSPVSQDSKIWSSAVGVMSLVSMEISSSKKKKRLIMSSQREEK